MAWLLTHYSMATKLGELLNRMSINKAELGRKTGITRQRISELSTRENALLRFDEAQQIAKALGMDMNQLSAALSEDKKPTSGDEGSSG
jgi:DNA-binding Xre family transcriptional regulator